MVGELELSMGDYESAKTSLTMALSKDEEQKADENYVKTAKPNTDLGILCMRTNRCKEAIRYFEAALEIDPADLSLRSNLAEAYLRDDRLDDAEKEFLRVLKTAPDHIESRIGLAAVYSRAHVVEILLGSISRDECMTLWPLASIAAWAANTEERENSDLKRIERHSEKAQGAYYARG
jgi:tetratricopeptide (TPR) repeat protein